MQIVVQKVVQIVVQIMVQIVVQYSSTTSVVILDPNVLPSYVQFCHQVTLKIVCKIKLEVLNSLTLVTEFELRNKETIYPLTQ